MVFCGAMLLRLQIVKLELRPKLTNDILRGVFSIFNTNVDIEITNIRQNTTVKWHHEFRPIFSK